MTTATQAYGESWYWDNRYSNEPGPFDWYQKYQTLAPIINLYVPRDHRILVVGCGNSAFSEGMVDDGYRDVINNDISTMVIEAINKKIPRSFTVEVYGNECPNVRDMNVFQSESFGAIVDKWN